MEVVVTTGATRDEKKLQSKCHHQQTNTQFFTGRMTFLSPNQQSQSTEGKSGWPVKGKASSLDIASLTILNSSALQPQKWQPTGIDCSTAAHAVAAQSPH